MTELAVSGALQAAGMSESAKALAGVASLRRTPRLVVAIPALLLLLVLLPTLLNTSQGRVAAEHGRPTPPPTPTATPLPSPTAMPGYEPYVDGADNFVIQRPLSWTCSASNPGVDCVDSPDEQKYRLQVQLPGDWTLAHTGTDPTDASVWVDYALSAFAGVPGRSYQRMPTSPSEATIGGVGWRSGAAVVGIEPADSGTPAPSEHGVRIRVQVFATLHNDRPYIIALYAADDQFASGTDAYFHPMLKSFAFLSSNS